MQQAQTQPRVQKCTGHPTSLLSRQLRAGNDMDILKRLPGYPEECPCVFASVPSISASPRKPSIADQSLQSRNQSHMGPGQSFDPVWVLMVMFGIMQVLIIALLVMPMPSNKVRGIVQGGLSKFWHTQEYVKKTSWVLLTLNSYYLYDAAKSLLEHNKIYAAGCESYSLALYFQRNVLISGGSVFLFFVMRRLLDIQGQLFDTRQLAKEAAAQQRYLLQDDHSAAPDIKREHQRRLQNTLSKLDRVASFEDVAAAAAAGGNRSKQQGYRD